MSLFVIQHALWLQEDTVIIKEMNKLCFEYVIYLFRLVHKQCVC